MNDLILVVDDDVLTRIQLRELLEQAGYRVIEAINGEQALQLYIDASPDLVLLDAIMPNVDGFTCCTQLRKLPQGQHTPVLMVTGLFDTLSVEKGFAAGVTDYIIKPINWSVLRQRMRRLLEASHTMEKLRQQTEQSQLFANVTLKIRDSLQIDEILQTSVTEVQKLLKADRVLIFRLHSDGSGMVLKEAVVSGFPVILGRKIQGPCLGEDYIQKFCQGRISVIADVEEASIAICHKNFLQQFTVKANVVVPILLKNQLWGLLIAHQCAHPRHWTSWETELLKQLADQIGIALAQAKLLEKETRQREELSRSNEELQQFAFIASHDLQEPLRKIQAFSSRLKVNFSSALTPQGHDYLQRMENATRRMQVLIDDLLILSRVTTRGQAFVQVNLSQVTQEVLSDLEVLIQQSGGYLEVGELPTLYADSVQMRQLLQNLISNALKFHRQEQSPLVKIYSQIPTSSNDQCQIFVEDNGIGFDEKYLDRIFNVFQRLHGRSEYEGTGIGLAICRKIVERHQGSITAESKPGKGARFIVTLPRNSS